jgi:hypothetical protein
MLNNEYARLDCRLRLPDPVVGPSVLIEATRTHNGRRRRAYFAENASRWAPYNGRIFGLVVGPFVLVFDRSRRAVQKYRIRHRARHAVIGAHRWATTLQEHPSAEAD